MVGLLLSLSLGSVLILGGWLHQSLWAQGSHFTPGHLTFHRQLDALGVLDHHVSAAHGSNQNTSWHDRQASLEKQTHFGEHQIVAGPEIGPHNGATTVSRTWDVPVVQISAAAPTGMPGPGLTLGLSCSVPVAPPPVIDAGIRLVPRELPISSVAFSPPTDPPRTLRLGC